MGEGGVSRAPAHHGGLHSYHSLITGSSLDVIFLTDDPAPTTNSWLHAHAGNLMKCTPQHAHLGGPPRCVLCSNTA